MTMKKLRWAMEGEFWELDSSTPATMDGVARPVAGELPLPLGLSRGARLSRPKQIDFMQRFMAAPFIPSFSNGVGFSLQRLLSLPSFARDACFTTLLGQFNVQKFAASLKRSESIWKRFSDPQFYSLNLCWEWLITPQDTLLLTSEAQADHKTPRKKAVFHHKFPNHNLTVEASSPSLFLDDDGNYWDVPFTLAMDVGSIAPHSATSCHFCISHNAGSPRPLTPSQIPPPPTLLPGLSAKSAFSFNKHFDIWKSEAPKARMVQPYDILLSNPHVSASTILGSVITASLGENSITLHGQDEESFMLCTKGANYAASADLFASASLSAQLGNFQKNFLDLTRFHARLDIPSGSKFVNGAYKVARALYNSEAPTAEALQAINPSATLSFQQQMAGPFSLRVDSGVSVDLKKDWYLNVNDPVFAVEYAMHVLGSAKAVAWYSPKQREFMIELRFFET
ncbi:protein TRIGALACTOSYLDIACYLGLYCEROL 4, chloroplastic-like [Salvia divinorum]|uniref:Protein TRIGALACTOSYLDIACYLGLYCEROL 4, chloroplastic-like n=1 Tax=Salvia divinorum TaxID=28513 RepID=A0ABD1GZ64_SALDI